MSARAEILAEAWLDGSLSEAEATELRQHMADPTTRQQLADWLAWRSRLHRAYDDADAAAILNGHQVRRSAEANGARLLDHLHRHRSFGRQAPPWWRIGLGLVALLLGMVAWWTLAEVPEPRFSSSGTVLVDDQPLTETEQLVDQATIVVAADGRLDLLLADRSTVQLQGPARCRFTGLDGPHWTGELASGQLRCQTGPQHNRRSLFQTAYADLYIEGTDFQLVAESSFTGVELYQGALTIGDAAGTDPDPALAAGSCAIFDANGLAGTAELLSDDGLVGRWDFGTPARLIPNRVRGHGHLVATVPPTWHWVDGGGLVVPVGDFTRIAIDDPACIAALHQATAAMEWRIRLLPSSRAPLFIGAGGLRIDNQGDQRMVIGLNEQALSLADADGRLLIRITGKGDHWRYQIKDKTFSAPHRTSGPLPTDQQLASRWFIGLPVNPTLPQRHLTTSPFIIESLALHLRPPADWD